MLSGLVYFVHAKQACINSKCFPRSSKLSFVAHLVLAFLCSFPSPPSPSSHNAVSLPHAFTGEVAFTAKKKGKKGKGRLFSSILVSDERRRRYLFSLLLPSLPSCRNDSRRRRRQKRRRRRGLLLITFSPPLPSPSFPTHLPPPSALLCPMEGGKRKRYSLHRRFFAFCSLHAQVMSCCWSR